jgi:hypothetical protein
MTDANYTHITFVLDNSGSMQLLCGKTIEGYNSFIAEQKKQPGRATFSLYQFKNHPGYTLPEQGQAWSLSTTPLINPRPVAEAIAPVQVLTTYEFRDLNSVPDLTLESYVCDTMTPLNDAMGWAIDATGRLLSVLDEAYRPSKVIFVTLTDGFENQSLTYSREQVKAKIEHQRKVYDWAFVYLGANQDAIAVGQSYGIAAGSSMTYATNDASVGATYNNLSAAITVVRGMAGPMGPQGVSFTAAQRNDVLNANTVVTPVSTP